MATEEARSLLDSLMGGDRNAPLPSGAAVPPSKKRRTTSPGGGQLLLPGQRHKSCYDRDIDPLYTAWGVDVYELFTNTKSDLGTNPYVVDKAAHAEYQALSQTEKDKLGFDFFLFQKLTELVRQCDRTISRNKDKLAQELHRKQQQQRGGGVGGVVDDADDVDDGAVEMLARALLQVENLTHELEQQLAELDRVRHDEDAKKEILNGLLQVEQAQKTENDATEIKKDDGDEPPEAAVKKEQGAEGAVQVKQEEPASIKKEEGDQNPVKESNDGSSGENTAKKEETEPSASDQEALKDLQMELGQLTLQKQRLVFEIANLISRLKPLQESVETQHRNLHYIKSDISRDKTVCEVSGNFMSSRDADERIAAHYAGKQYMGWKLVRTKFQEMTAKYGRYGPPPPGRDSSSGPAPMMMGGNNNNNRRYSGRAGGGSDRGGGGRGRDRYDGGGGYRGGGGGGGPDRGGRWERDRGDWRGPPQPRGQWRR